MSPILAAAGAVPPAPDDRLGAAQQAGRNARAARLHRDDVADLREAVGSRRRLVRTPASRADQFAARHIGQETRLPSLELTTALRRRARRVAHADAVAAAGRQPARGVPEAVRPGRHRQGTRGDSPRDRQHPRSRQGTGARGCRPASASATASSSATTSTRCARSSAACRWRRSRTRRALDIPDAPVGTPNDITEHFKLMFDLMALAFQADITRVITFSMDREASMRTYTNLGIAEGVPSAVASREQSRRSMDKLVQIQKLPHGGVREVRRAAGEGAGGGRHACSITRRSCSAAT